METSKLHCIKCAEKFLAWDDFELHHIRHAVSNSNHSIPKIRLQRVFEPLNLIQQDSAVSSISNNTPLIKDEPINRESEISDEITSQNKAERTEAVNANLNVMTEENASTQNVRMSEAHNLSLLNLEKSKSSDSNENPHRGFLRIRPLESLIDTSKMPEALSSPPSISSVIQSTVTQNPVLTNQSGNLPLVPLSSSVPGSNVTTVTLNPPTNTQVLQTPLAIPGRAAETSTTLSTLQFVYVPSMAGTAPNEIQTATKTNPPLVFRVVATGPPRNQPTLVQQPNREPIRVIIRPGMVSGATVSSAGSSGAVAASCNAQRALVPNALNSGPQGMLPLPTITESPLIPPFTANTGVVVPSSNIRGPLVPNALNNEPQGTLSSSAITESCLIPASAANTGVVVPSSNIRGLLAPNALNGPQGSSSLPTITESPLIPPTANTGVLVPSSNIRGPLVSNALNNEPQGTSSLPVFTESPLIPPCTGNTGVVAVSCNTKRPLAADPLVPASKVARSDEHIQGQNIVPAVRSTSVGHNVARRAAAPRPLTSMASIPQQTYAGPRAHALRPSIPSFPAPQRPPVNGVTSRNVAVRAQSLRPVTPVQQPAAPVSEPVEKQETAPPAPAPETRESSSSPGVTTDRESTPEEAGLAIPVVSVSVPGVLSRLKSLGVSHFIPLSSQSLNQNGLMAIPLIVPDSANCFGDKDDPGFGYISLGAPKKL